MSELLLGGSLAAAFLAGMVALFAPCCITVLFPAYLAAAVRNRRWRVVPLTFVFAAGLATVLVPITLGVGALANTLLRAHSAVYALGGLLMLAFAAVVVLGFTWSLPMLRGAPDVTRTDSGGVYVLGVFSGAASACCAPVLAGVMTLSAVAPGPLASAGVGLAFVFGMVFPLVVLTTAWDRFGGDTARLRGRTVRYQALGRPVTTTTLDLLVAGLFAAMGVGLLVVAARGATIAVSFSAGVGLRVTQWSEAAARALAPIPDVVIGLGLLGVAAGALLLSARRRPPEPEPPAPRSCHDEETKAPLAP
jgi:cytochrome c-type biogenesis protein